ncbi:Serine/threonine-protein phosphatase 6 regulatory ankyrin repeat subunit C [Acipenser ruthenus]|uniref:Serine/threonine-protein phosphatase 6 regulatory ankyrin repeat subunit C n=1 Tax=Acipenser ruthenus TaxID=7906 RepID=A0A444V1K1_ACIRT|nr:Serine/threonine-protein phosphatase 6 regulatory ankyrin repeat subunit C [Acipenser ruthenus]
MDEPNVFGNTALHIACYTGQEAVANELVNHGANVNQPNERGCSPLHFAAVSTNGALCLELLVNNGADVSMQRRSVTRKDIPDANESWSASFISFAVFMQFNLRFVWKQTHSIFE